MLDVLATLAAIGCALVAGIFFVFSTFVMKALGNLTPAHGVAAMQAINIAVINPWFMVAFFGTAAVCAVVMVGTLARWRAPGATCLLAGSLFYLVGAVLVTVQFNVPQNNVLAAVGPTSPEAATLWVSYLSTWTAWNHVRTLAALAASASFAIALWLRR
jgi:uncharacterized membrane protein